MKDLVESAEECCCGVSGALPLLMWRQPCPGEIKGKGICMKDNNQTIEYIASCIRAAGYDPYAQIYGYIKTSNECYITRQGDARTLIKEVDASQLKNYIAVGNT